MNNLLERLHASLFFFIWKDSLNILKIGQFLPSAVLVGIAMLSGGLRLWVDAGSVEVNETAAEKSEGTPQRKWKTRTRNVIPPLAIMLATHLFGACTFWVAKSNWYINLPTVCGNSISHTYYFSRIL